MINTISFLWTSAAGTAYVIDLPAVQDIQIGDASELTKFNVEKGAKMTDHIRQEVYSLGFTCTLSNTPMRRLQLPSGDIVGDVKPLNGFNPLYYQAPFTPTPGGITRAAEGAIAKAFGGLGLPTSVSVLQFEDLDYVQAMLDVLRTAKNEASLINVFMPSRNLEDFLITNLEDAPKGKTWGQLKLTLEHARIVESRTVTAPKPTQPRANPKANNGSQSAKDAEAKANKQSIISKIFGSGIRVP